LVSEPGEALPWLMVSPDVSAARLLLATLERPGWQADAPRLVNGALGRLRAGHWDTTTANAWGVTALRRFAARFEGKPVVGTTRIGLAGAERRTDWAATDPDTRHALP